MTTVNPTISYSETFRFRAPREVREEIARKCFPDYNGKPEAILAWPRDKSNTNAAGKKAYLESCKQAELAHAVSIVVPNPEALKLEEVLALVVNTANNIVSATLNAARRKGEELLSSFDLSSIVDLLQESEDEEGVSSAKLSEEEQEIYAQLVDAFVVFKRYKEVSAASYAISQIALMGKAKDMLHAIKNEQHFPKFAEAFAKWIDDTNADQRPLVERALKRQTRYLEKARAEYQKIVGASTITDEIVA